MADNNRSHAAARKFDIKAATRLLERWGEWLPHDKTRKFLEDLSKPRKSGRPRKFVPQLDAYIYVLVEVAKERGSKTGKAREQVWAYFKWLSTRPTKLEPRSTGYTIDQIKRAHIRGGPSSWRVVLGDDGQRHRVQAYPPIDVSKFEAFLDKRAGKLPRSKTGAKTTKI